MTSKIVDKISSIVDDQGRLVSSGKYKRIIITPKDPTEKLWPTLILHNLGDGFVLDLKNDEVEIRVLDELDADDF